MSIEQKITFPNDADDSKTTIIKPGETFRQRNIRVISGFEDQTDGASYYVDFEISCHLSGDIGIVEVIPPLDCTSDCGVYNYSLVCCYISARYVYSSNICSTACPIPKFEYIIIQGNIIR